MKKNIIWLHSHFLYWMGGTKFIYQVIEEFKKDRLVGKILVITENNSDFVKNKYKQIGIELVSLDNISSNNFIYWLFLPIFLLIELIKLKKIIRDRGLNSSETVVISSMFPMNVLAGLLNFKHVQNCYEPFAFFYDEQFISQFSLIKKTFIKLLAFLYSPLDKWATRNADVLLTLNSTTQETIREVYKKESKKTQAGVNSSLFKPYISKKIQKKYQGKKIVIHSTDYSPVKGTDRVITAFSLVVKKIPEAKLLITTTIDDHKKRKPYKDLAKRLKLNKKISFLGFLPINEVPQYYTIASVMVQGAFSEKSGTTSMSLPVKEAMCCETPAIRPNAGGEDVIDGKSGFLVDPRNTKLLAEKMILLLQDKKLSQKMGKRARKDILKKYTWHNTAQVFLDNLQ